MSKALATNVASIVLSAALVFGFAFAFAAPAKADTLSDLQAEVQSLLAQIAALQGSSSSSGSGTMMSSSGCFTFTMSESQGSTGTEVMHIQQFLNGHGFTVAATGAGSPGNETSYFGPATKAAVIAFQNANAASILTPIGLTTGTGYWGPASMTAANGMCAMSTGTGTGTTTGTGTGTTVGGGLTISAGSQPMSTLAPKSALRVPFTVFTLTNTSGAAVTVNSVTVQRTGLAQDSDFAGVVLLDQTGLQLGTSRTFDSNHEAMIGTPFTLQAGQSMTYTVAGNISASPGAGDVASLSVVGVNTTVPVSGSLPIVGASQTMNSTLVIGTATMYVSSYDPNSYRSEPIGTTGLIFSGLRVTAGSAEDAKLFSITWNQTGSVGSTDIGNLVTVVNGTSYPVTADSTGKYYTATFPGGILIPKGNTMDVYLKGDLVGNDASGRTIEFDVYRNSDIYLVGQTYGYGLTPTQNGTCVTTPASGTHGSAFVNSSVACTGTVGSPFFQGSTVSVTAGQLSTVSSSGSVGAQNIAINVPNQPLGGFQTNFTGEPVTVQSLAITDTRSSGFGTTTSVSLVDGNGNVVAGPVDEVAGTNNTGTITFNTAITFPVGAMTYTIKGTVASNAVNGETLQLSTTPSGWTSPQGQTSGSNVSITAGVFSMSTMTVEGPSLVISAASSPASQQVAKGTQNFEFADINLDASQSGEDLRISSLPITVTSANPTDLTNCQLWNGSTALNGNQVINTSNWTTETGGAFANFIFDNALTIPKGTVVTLMLKCSLPSSASGSYAVGVDSNGILHDPSPVGVGSGITLTTGNSDLTVQQGTSGTMTVGTALLAPSLSTQAYTIAAGGTTGVTIGTFTLQPSSDSVNLQKIGLQLNSNTASSSDVMKAYIYAANNLTTPLGTVIFTGTPTGHYYYATSTVSGMNLPQNVATSFVIKADLATVGIGNSGHSGHNVVIDLADAQGTGAGSGAQVDSSTYSGSNSGVGMFRSFPTITYGTSGGTLTSGTNNLISMTIAANASGNVLIKKLIFSVATTTASIGGGTLTFTGPNGSVTATAPILSSDATSPSTITVKFDSTTNTSDSEITAGSSKTYNMSVSGVTGITGNTSGSVSVSLKHDSFPGVGMFSTSTLSGSNVIWSPESTSTLTQLNTSAYSDFTNGYGLPGCFSTYGIGQDCPPNTLSF